MNQAVSRILMIGLAVALAATLVPTASAQQQKPNFAFTDVTFDKPMPMAADVDVIKATVKGTVGYVAPGSVAGPAVIPQAVLKFTADPVCDKNGITITGPGSVPVNLAGASPQKSTFDVEAKFSITASQQAPGETDIKCTFKGRVLSLQSNTYSDSDESSITTTLKVRFLGLLSASVPVTIIEAGPQAEITYEIQLTNLGNALTNVNFHLATETPEGWSPVPPTPIIMQSAQQGGTEFTKKVNFLIQTPHHNGWNNDEKTFQLKIMPSSTKDAQTTGNEIAVNVLARVRGIYVPGPEPILMAVAILGAALVARMVRNAA